MDDEQHVYGDFLDERYLIDRREHEEHAEDNEEEPDEPDSIESDDVEVPEAPGNLTSAERLGWRIGWRAGHAAAEAEDDEDITALQVAAYRRAAETLNDTVPTLLELIDQYANETAGRELGDQHHNADRERTEIVRRLDLVRERAADDDGTVLMILEILNGTYPPSGTATHRAIQSWTAVNATPAETAAPVPTLAQLLDQLTDAAYAWGATATSHGTMNEATLAHEASADAVRAEILRRANELVGQMVATLRTLTGGLL